LTDGTTLFPEQKASFISALLKPEEASAAATAPSEACNRNSEAGNRDSEACQGDSSVERRPVVKLKKKVSFKESVSVRSAENGVLAATEELKFSPEDTKRPVAEDRGKEEEVMTVVNLVGGVVEDRVKEDEAMTVVNLVGGVVDDRGKEEEVMTAVNFASLGHKGSPSYVREDVRTKSNFFF
jgi:hypothetical protein